MQLQRTFDNNVISVITQPFEFDGLNRRTAVKERFLRGMASSARFFTRTSKFVQARDRIGAFGGRAISRSHGSGKCQTARVLQQVDSERAFRNHEGFESESDRSNVWFVASGLFLSLFNWGEKEEEKIPELIMSIKRSIWLIQVEILLRLPWSAKNFVPSIPLGMCVYHFIFL